MRDVAVSKSIQAEEGQQQLQGHWRVAIQLFIDEMCRYMEDTGVLKKMISAAGVIVVLLVLVARFK